MSQRLVKVKLSMGVIILVKAKKILTFLLALLLLTTYSFVLPKNPAGALTLYAPKNFEGHINQNYVKLMWENPNDSFSFTVIEKRIDQDSFYPVVTLNKTITSYNDYSITNGHVYTYRARTYYSGNYSSYTPEVKVTVLYSTSLEITKAYSDHVDLEWSVPAFPPSEIPDYKTIIERRQMNYNTWEEIASLPITENYYRDVDVATDTSYYYRIRTQFGKDRFSSYVPHMGGLSTRTLFPLTTNLWGHAISADRIKLEWDISSLGNNKVFLQKLDPNSGFVTIYSGTGDNYVDRMLQPGKTYTYRLYMLSKNGNMSEYTEEISINTEPLPMITGLEANAVSFDCIALSWEYPYDDETGFEIWRKSALMWELISLVPKNTHDFYDYSTVIDTVYEYKVRAIRGDTAFSPFAYVEDIINKYPGSPGELVCTLNQGYLSLFSQSYVPAGNVYTLEARKGLNSQWEEIKSVDKGTLVARLPVSSQTEYYLRLRANIGNLETVGPELHFFGSVPEAPRNLQVQHLGYNRLTLVWEDMTDKEEGYYIYRSVRYADGSLKRTLIGSVEKDVESFTDNSPVEGGHVYYEAVAYNYSGESGAAGISIRVPSRMNYKDIAQYQWAYDSIYTLQGFGAFEDTPNDLFNPHYVVTRGQLARMIIKSFNIPYGYSGLKPPADITPYHIYYKDLMTAVRLGLLHPDENGNIYPNKSVTRREILLMLNGALGNRGLSLIPYETNVLERFSDFSLVAPEEANIMASFVGADIITGKSGQQLSLQTYATKVEAAAFIYRTLTRYKLIPSL